VVAETIYNPETRKFYAEGPMDIMTIQTVIKAAVNALQSPKDITFMTLMMQISRKY
jgi:hypothetical protein